MDRIGIAELQVILVLLLFRLIPFVLMIGGLAWAIVTLRRVRSAQEAFESRLAKIEHRLSEREIGKQQR